MSAAPNPNVEREMLKRAEMRWMSVEDAEITVLARTPASGGDKVAPSAEGLDEFQKRTWAAEDRVTELEAEVLDKDRLAVEARQQRDVWASKSQEYLAGWNAAVGRSDAALEHLERYVGWSNVDRDEAELVLAIAVLEGREVAS